MGENQKKILHMLSDGKINVDEAQRLLSLVDTDADRENHDTSGVTSRSSAKYMRVVVEPKPGAPVSGDRHDHHPHKVNIRVPVGLIRAGMKFASLIPADTADQVDRALKEKGFKFDIRKIKDEDLEELITSLRESEVNVDSEFETVRIYAE